MMGTRHTPADVASAAEVVLLRSRGDAGATASVQGSLALDLTPRTAPPRPRPRLAHSNDLVATSSHDRRQVDAVIARYLAAAVEIAAGDRPVSQVLRHTVPEVYDELSRRARTVAAAGGPPAGRAAGPHTTRPVILSVRTALVRDDAAEASAHVRYGRRSRAVAARFEVVRDRWQCVALSFG